VSIWAFDKSEFAKRKAISDKAVVEQLFQIMKRDFAVIKDCKVCSSIIQIIEVHASSSSLSCCCLVVLSVLMVVAMDGRQLLQAQSICSLHMK
jgi:hypothetical protein